MLPTGTPADAELIDLNRPDQAPAQLADLLAALRTGSTARAELESQANQALDELRHGGGYLFAVLATPQAQPTVLTGVSLTGEHAWSDEHTTGLRRVLDDLGGVTDTAVPDTELGPVAVVERAPREQPGEDRPCWQLLAFLALPGTADLVVLTLSAMSPRGWDVHRAAFVDLVSSAAPAG